MVENYTGITIKELKKFLETLPEEDSNGDDTEVWIQSGRNLSSPASRLSRLNEGDIFIGLI